MDVARRVYGKLCSINSGRRSMSDSLELIADGTPVTAARPIHRCRTAGLREIATSRRAKIESRSPLRYCYTLRDAVAGEDLLRISSWLCPTNRGVCVSDLLHKRHKRTDIIVRPEGPHSRPHRPLRANLSPATVNSSRRP